MSQTAQNINGDVDQEPTLEDVIKTVNFGFTELTKDLDQKLLQVKNELTEGLDQKLLQVKNELTEDLDQKLVQVKNELKTELVTKDYLDEKFHDLRGDLTVLMRKEDTKVVTLISILRERNVLTQADVQRVLAMELFPRTAGVL